MAQIERLGSSRPSPGRAPPDYPALLAQVDDAPPVLYVRGAMTPADEWAVAMVGTRKGQSLRTRGRQAVRKSWAEA